ncbi:barstar family protein [Streptomyces sp. CB01881]|uniref:barstar family protein n=1 Tax=Streptomyces sp. CB01881 TaxID=2078691 RepID=UPI000CDBD33C|nr:barstar family protein [Streptomyces sp. CB01881]AUY48695.1 Barstar domain containing protein [Streptomyces sp. CB01881]TYC77186.1 Barstar domain containing protein [Streptomyces sp. CB01881]
MDRALYRLTGEEDEDLWAYARDATGLFRPLPGGRRRVRLLGCVPQGGLERALRHLGGRRAEAGNAHLDLLDHSGAELGSYFVNWVTAREVRPSALGPELVDLTLDLWGDDLLPHSEWPWELRRTGRLDRPGLWRSLGPAGRHAWLSVALWHHGHRGLPDAPPGTVYELDGRQLVDEDSFYCAVGEAVNGPGGYFGWNLDALDDCLGGRWGATAPFTLRWHHSDVARARLARFPTVLEILRRHRVEVDLR